MTGWLNSKISHKLTALLVVSVLAMVAFACFTAAPNHAHGFYVEAVCETVMTLADNAVIQTGLILLLVLAGVYLRFRFFNTFSLRDTLDRLQVFHGLLPNYLVSSQEHSYLRELFSSGVIHAKLHSVTS